MVAVARRLAGLLVVVALVAGVPLAAARASCVCDHGHDHGRGAAEPHICTAACTAATCPMHRVAAARTRANHAPAASRDVMRCSCASEAQALIGQASVAAVLPTLVTVDAPPLARLSRPSVPEAPLSLAPPPPAPPPRV